MAMKIQTNRKDLMTDSEHRGQSQRASLTHSYVSTNAHSRTHTHTLTLLISNRKGCLTVIMAPFLHEKVMLPSNSQSVNL